MNAARGENPERTDQVWHAKCVGKHEFDLILRRAKRLSLCSAIAVSSYNFGLPVSLSLLAHPFSLYISLPVLYRFFFPASLLLKMREVISVHVGQAGVQIGNACCKFSLLGGGF